MLKTYLHYLNIDSNGNDKKEKLGTWKLAFIIAGPIAFVCLIAVLFINYWTGSNNFENISYMPAPQILPADQQPILSAAVSLRDMIEMTTSGSGSG